MAELSVEDRGKVVNGLMHFWSNLWELTEFSMQDLEAAVDATDTWIEDNQGDFNLALPLPARTSLTVSQKTLMFCAVSLARVSIAFLRRIFGGIL